MSATPDNPLKCPRCGAPLPANAPEGLCPRCVAANLATETEVNPQVGPEGTEIIKPAPTPPPTVEEVAKLFPQLEILELLGRGGMGAVYKVRQPRLNRLAALKILTPDKKGDPQFAERFEREARTLALLHQPNIVAIYDFGEAQGNFYLLMEYVNGLTLRQLLQTRKLSPEEALAIVPKICEALQYAHQQGVVHRDIKPENILLDQQGQVKIADFGIAKIVGQSAPAGLTQEQQVIGTPHYMAPEQVEHPKTVDHRADIYSLGVVLYEMLTSELPIGKFAPPSRKVHVDVRLDEVVLHALEKEPERRYQEARQVQTDVEAIKSGHNAPAAHAAMASLVGSQMPSDKTILPAFLLAFFFGIFGAHRFYVGKLYSGLAQLGLFFWCVLLIIACAYDSWPGQPTLGIVLGFSFIASWMVWPTVDWILIVCKAFRDGEGRRITEWIRPKTAAEVALAMNPAPTQPPRVPPTNPPRPPAAGSAPGNVGAAASAAAPTTPSSAALIGFNTAKVTAPAVGLMIVAATKLFGAILGALFLAGAVGTWNGSRDFGGWVFPFTDQWSAVASASVIFWKAIPGLLIFYGAYQMLRLRSYAWSMAGAIISIVACSLLGLPVGIWALIILTRPEVRDVFEIVPGKAPAKSRSALVGPAIAMTILCLLLGGGAAALLADVFGDRIHPVLAAGRGTNTVADLLEVTPADANTQPLEKSGASNNSVAGTVSSASEGTHHFRSTSAPNFTKTFSVTPGGKLTLKADRGNVHVTGGTGSAVEVRVTRVVTRADAATAANVIRDHRIELDQEGGNISITAHAPPILNGGSILSILRRPNLEVEYEITVPTQYNVELNTSGGNVELAYVRGNSKLGTMGGNVTLDHIDGEVTGKTMGGNIHASACTAKLEMQTQGGNVQIEQFSGPWVRAGTSGGNVHADFAAAPTDDCDLHTSGGSVHAKLPSSARITIDAETMGGSVHSGFALQPKNKFGNSSLHGPLNGGGPVLKLRTMGGNIEVAQQ